MKTKFLFKIMKECFKCKKTLSLDEFYKHSEMADGHLNKCKNCTKKDAEERYYDPESRKRIIEYERLRFQTPERKAKRLLYQRRMRSTHPTKYRARQMVQNALKTGEMVKMPCRICGNPKSEAHHTDYRKPLDVMWLCRQHHMIEEGKIPYQSI